MLTTPMDILTQFPVRKTKSQKQHFRDAVMAYVKAEGWNAQVEPGSFGAQNLVIGDPEKAHFLITAHYDTPARMLIPNFITPCNWLPYVLYQLALIAGILAAAVAVSVIPAILGLPGWIASVLSCAVAWGILALLVLGPANPSNANDNTSGVVTLLEILRTMPQNQRSRVCFVLFDLEEAGLLGSASYRKTHPTATNRQLVINLDCVGEGDHLRYFPTRALKKNLRPIRRVYDTCGYFGVKSLLVADKGFSFYPSDQMNFPYGIGVAALKEKKGKLCIDRIHTPRDAHLDQTNVNILRAAITSIVTGHAVKKG